MMHLFTLARRAARFRALLLVGLAPAFGACDADRLANSSEDPLTVAPVEPVGAPTTLSFSSSFRGGIPLGTFAQPTNAYGSRHNGGTRNVYPEYLLAELQAIKERGGRVMLVLPGAPGRYTDRSGNFSLAMWKAAVDRYKGIDFSSYIKDGTVIGNFLIDEPSDRNNWRNRKAISAATVEEMARYSKSLWPGLPTVARVRPDYLDNNHRYLDAAWSQYHSRFGDPRKFIESDAAVAKRKGLALVVGMNVLRGNGGREISASQLESWGAALLSDSYPCAFLSWKYDSKYMGQRGIQAAMESLSRKAQNRSSKSCRGTNGQTAEPTDPPAEPPAEEPEAPLEEEPEPPAEEPEAPVEETEPPAERPSEPTTEEPATSPSPVAGQPTIRLSVTSWSEKRAHYMRLTWSGARGSSIDLYRNGALRRLLVANARNDGKYTNVRRFRRATSAATYVYKVCEKGSSNCSNEVTVTFKK
jgi:hypothetical protein